MKLFLLINMQNPTHGETRSMLIAATSDENARRLAQSTQHVPCHNSGDLEGIKGYGDEGADLWGDFRKSCITEIGRAGSVVTGEGILLTDYIYA